MKLNDLLAVSGYPIFGPDNIFGFDRDWFPESSGLESEDGDDFEALAETGRLIAEELAFYRDPESEEVYTVEKLVFDGVPYALRKYDDQGDGFFYVVDTAAYNNARLFLRTFMSEASAQADGDDAADHKKPTVMDGNEEHCAYKLFSDEIIGDQLVHQLERLLTPEPQPKS
jgi:hypothetical protein